MLKKNDVFASGTINALTSQKSRTTDRGDFLCIKFYGIQAEIFCARSTGCCGKKISSVWTEKFFWEHTSNVEDASKKHVYFHLLTRSQQDLMTRIKFRESIKNNFRSFFPLQFDSCICISLSDFLVTRFNLKICKKDSYIRTTNFSGSFFSIYLKNSAVNWTALWDKKKPYPYYSTTCYLLLAYFNEIY